MVKFLISIVYAYISLVIAISLQHKVIRFGQLFNFSLAKSFPFWETLSECKDTKYNQITGIFWREIFAKNS
jgi:hypothetical protein